MEVIEANNKPFVARVNNAEALLYEDHIKRVKLLGTSKYGVPESFIFLKDRALDTKTAYKDSDWISTVVIDERCLMELYS